VKKDKLDNIKFTGFKTPDQYFEKFDDNLLEKLSEYKSIRGVAKTGYKIPENYFDTFEDNVFERLTEKEIPIVKLNTRKKLYYMSGIAAALLLLFAVFFNQGEQEISAEMVQTYFQDSDLDSYELAELLVKADILEEDFTLVETDYSEDNLESYLLENVDIESILQE
jgi:hypothetical protein